jgi:hypothetical protein
MTKRRTPEPKQPRIPAVLIIYVGIIILTIGILLWQYTAQIIRAHETLLSNPNITQETRWRYQGSLEWWNIAAITTYYPIALTLIIAGLATTLTTLIYKLIKKP